MIAWIGDTQPRRYLVTAQSVGMLVNALTVPALLSHVAECESSDRRGGHGREGEGGIEGGLKRLTKLAAMVDRASWTPQVPDPETQKPKTSTRNPKPKARSPKPETLNPGIQMRGGGRIHWRW